jgi:hypothetical protein
MKESVNIYTSACCGVPANKPACVKVRAQQSKPKGKKGKGGRENKPEAPEFATLGSWRCGQCNKPCSVTVSPRPPKDIHQEVAKQVTGTANEQR